MNREWLWRPTLRRESSAGRTNEAFWHYTSHKSDAISEISSEKATSMLSSRTTEEVEELSAGEEMKLRRKYESMDKVDVDFVDREFNSSASQYINRLRSHLYNLFEAKKITLMDPKFVQYTLERLNAIDEEIERKKSINRMLEGHRSSVKCAIVQKFAREDSYSLTSSSEAKKDSSKKLQCYIDTWDDDKLSERWNNKKMCRLQKEANRYVISGFLDEKEYDIGAQKTPASPQTVANLEEKKPPNVPIETPYVKMPALNNCEEGKVTHTIKPSPGQIKPPHLPRTSKLVPQRQGSMNKLAGAMAKGRHDSTTRSTGGTTSYISTPFSTSATLSLMNGSGENWFEGPQ